MKYNLRLFKINTASTQVENNREITDKSDALSDNTNVSIDSEIKKLIAKLKAQCKVAEKWPEIEKFINENSAGVLSNTKIIYCSDIDCQCEYIKFCSNTKNKCDNGNSLRRLDFESDLDVHAAGFSRSFKIWQHKTMNNILDIEDQTDDDISEDDNIELKQLMTKLKAQCKIAEKWPDIKKFINENPAEVLSNNKIIYCSDIGCQCNYIKFCSNIKNKCDNGNSLRRLDFESGLDVHAAAFSRSLKTWKQNNKVTSNLKNAKKRKINNRNGNNHDEHTTFFESEIINESINWDVPILSSNPSQQADNDFTNHAIDLETSSYSKKQKFNITTEDNVDSTHHVSKRPTVLTSDEITREETAIKYYESRGDASEDDINQLLEHEKLAGREFEYDKNFNSDMKVELLIAKVDAVPNSCLGVFAKYEIKSNGKTLGRYAGRFLEKDPNNHYTFALWHKKGVTVYLDAEQQGDWTRFINHSPTPNLIAKTEYDKKGNPNVCFYAARDIKPGEQLTFDYTQSYQCEFKLLNIDASCTPLTPKLLFSKTINGYGDNVMTFDEKTINDFSLNIAVSEQIKGYIIPKSCLIINEIFNLKKAGLDFQKQLDLLEKQLVEDNNLGIYHDLSILAINNEGEFFPSHQQQRVNAIMLACYYGLEECIDIIIENDNYVNRPTLISGELCLNFLMKGTADIATKTRICNKLLEFNTLKENENAHYLPYPFMVDYEGKTLLHYAIIEDAKDLIKDLLEIDSPNNYFIQAMFNKHNKETNKHVDLNYCLKTSKFEILKILLDHMLLYSDFLKDNFAKSEYTEILFNKEVICSMSFENLETFRSIICLHTYQKYFNNSILLKFLDERIEQLNGESRESRCQIKRL